MDPSLASEYDRTPMNVGRIILPPKTLDIVRYGFCHPHRILVALHDKVVYLWDKVGEVRKEHFFNEEKPSREYAGNQYSFLEYCANAEDFGSILDTDVIIDYFHRYCSTNPQPTDPNLLLPIELEMPVIEMYRKNLEKILTI